MRRRPAGASVGTMTENIPDSFDPQQPDLPTLAVDPDPETSSPDGQAPTTEPDDGSGEGVPG
jgi:hypothetical protein